MSSLRRTMAAVDRRSELPLRWRIMDHGAVTILDGATALADTERTLEAIHRLCARLKHEVSTLRLRDLAIAPCTGCFMCWVRTPGICVQDDAGRNVAASVIRGDVLVLVTPITFGGYSSELKKAVDRTIPVILPFFERLAGETHHQPRYAEYPSIVAVGIGPATPEEERLFRQLVKRHARNMHAPAVEVCVVPRDGEGNALVLEAMRRILGR
jgi:hypothetical protein